jgi:hypothetical protein
MLEQTTDANLLLRKKNRNDQDDMHDMATIMRCNLSNLSGVEIPDKHLLGLSYFSTDNFNID